MKYWVVCVFAVFSVLHCKASEEISEDSFESVKTVKRLLENVKHNTSVIKAAKNTIEKQRILMNKIPESTEIEEKSEYPILFISSSIPSVTLRNYLTDLERVGGVMVLRGLIGDAHFFKPTLKFIHRILKKRPECKGLDCELYNVEILIDPYLFSEYQVTKVPALTMHTGIVSHCDENNKGSKNIIIGDRSLSYLISEWVKIFR